MLLLRRLSSTGTARRCGVLVVVLIALLTPPTDLSAAPPGALQFPSISTNHLRPLAVLDRLPLNFEPNQGQTDPRVRFLARSAGATLFLTGHGLAHSPPRLAPRPGLSPGRHVVRGGAVQDRQLHLSNPIAVAVGRQGNVYVFDQGTWSVDELSPTGRLLATWPIEPAPSRGPDSGRGGLGLDDAGNIYVLLSTIRQRDHFVGSIAQLSPTGHTVAQWSSPVLLNANGLAVRRDGTLFVLMPSQTSAKNPSGLVLTLTSGGKVVGRRQLSTDGYDFLDPLAIAIDPRGRVDIVGGVGRFGEHGCALVSSASSRRGKECYRPNSSSSACTCCRSSAGVMSGYG